MGSKKTYLPEEALVLALRKGEQIGYAALYDMYAKNLLVVISRILKDDVAKFDVLQDVIVKIFKSMHKYSAEKGAFYTFILTLAKHHTIDVCRRKQARNQQRNISIDDVLYLHSQAITSQMEVYNTERIGLKELLKTLKPDYQFVLEQVYYKGYSFPEIAEEFNIPLGTVKTRVKKALEQMRKLYLDDLSLADRSIHNRAGNDINIKPLICATRTNCKTVTSCDPDIIITPVWENLLLAMYSSKYINPSLRATKLYLSAQIINENISMELDKLKNYPTPYPYRAHQQSYSR